MVYVPRPVILADFLLVEAPGQYPEGFTRRAAKCLSRPEPNVRTVLVTDGEKVMSMGDQGAHGMCIPLYQVCRQICPAGIRPHNCLPVTLDVGCNNQVLSHKLLVIIC
uniref:Malic enzyme N-terminal domain-containing protein n=1 Tax=Timema genevievae TaxID=629358 RepID=A0A7R9PJ14_TIMGE|nr:unnamed protein product [Timema genevievae]